MSRATRGHLLRARHPSRVFIARNGRHELTDLMLSTAQVQGLVERMLTSSGRRIDISQPFVDAMLPDGHRLHVVLEGISRGFFAVKPAHHPAAGPVARPGSHGAAHAK